MKIIKIIGLLLLLFLGYIIISPFAIYYDYAYVCDYTGSHKGHTEWIFGFTTDETYQESHLEKFLKSNHPEKLQYYWESYAGTGKNIWGQSISFGHGRPAAVTLGTRMIEFNQIIDHLSDQEKLNLVKQLRKRDRDLNDEYYFNKLLELHGAKK